MPSSARDPIRLTFAIGNVLFALLLCAGVFLALPVRFWPVDVLGAALAVVLLVSAVGLWLNARWRGPALRASALAQLAIGLIVFAALALAVTYLGGTYNQVGRAALSAWIVSSVLLIPYLIVYPTLQLLWLRREERREV